MNLIQLFKNIRPFVKPYRLLVVVTLLLTLIGSAMQQVNAIVLDRTVDAINALIGTDFTFKPFILTKLLPDFKKLYFCIGRNIIFKPKRYTFSLNISTNFH